MGKIDEKNAVNKRWREKNPDYWKKWREANPNYGREHYQKNNPRYKGYYQENRDKILSYYQKRNSNSKTKLLVKENFKALSLMPLADLFIFQQLQMKSSTPVAIGAFFYALKLQLLEKNKTENDN